jgi:histone deacetylase 1/2
LKPSNQQVLGASRQALGVLKPSSSIWHARLGHAAAPVVQQVISHHKLLFSRELNNHVCNACQQGKSHQLPYTHSSVISSNPMDLVFSHVWGPAPTSVGRHTYYVSFIDDHTKFVWIYLLRQKSDVFKCFQEFQQLVERQFNKKIRSIQTDWGGEYQALNSFFQTYWYCASSFLSTCTSAKWFY